MDMINKLADVFDIERIIPKSLYLSIDDYKLINRNSPESIRSFIFGILPVSAVPRKFHDELAKLNIIISDYELLCRNPSNDININVMATSLYELITVYNKMPSEQYLVEFNHDMDITLDNFHRYKVLHRFFENKGTVYWSESLENGSGPLFIRHKNGYISNITVYEALVKEGLLRKAREEDSQLILNYKSQKQLAIILSKIKNIDHFNLARLTKNELIVLMTETSDFNKVVLHHYFYLLNDNYQSCKEWLVKEHNYFRVYWLFNQTLRGASKHYASVIRELINSDDFKTAQKLANIYNEKIKNSDFAAFTFSDEDREKIEKQIVKIGR